MGRYSNKKTSRRNRHTGHVNAFKQQILDAGKHYRCKVTGKIYAIKQMAIRHYKDARGNDRYHKAFTQVRLR